MLNLYIDFYIYVSRKNAALTLLITNFITYLLYVMYILFRNIIINIILITYQKHYYIVTY